MHPDFHPEFLLASGDPELLRTAEPALAADGARVHIVLSAEAVLLALERHACALVLLDTRLPDMEIGQLLAAVRAHPGGAAAPIVLFSDTVTDEARARLREGVLADVVPFLIRPEFLALRVEAVLAAQERRRELEQLREHAAVHAQTDPLTGAYSRAALLSMLVRETDRVQRMNTSLCLILFDVDDFGHWNLRLGPAACDDLLAQTAARVQRLLRSYDLLGRIGKDKFLAALPGCSPVNAMLLSERMRHEVFAAPFQAAGKAIRLSACLAVASSQGRSPVVVLRELEDGLAAAKQEGPETIRRAAEGPHAEAAPMEFLSATTGDDLLAW